MDSEKSNPKLGKFEKVVDVCVPHGVEDFVWFEDYVEKEWMDDDESLMLEVLDLLRNNILSHDSQTNKPNIEEFGTFNEDNDEVLNQKEWSDGELEREILFLLQQQIANME